VHRDNRNGPEHDQAPDPQERPVITASVSRRYLCALLVPVIAMTLTLALGGSPAASAEPPTCFGRTATIVGDGGDERIEGTPETDVIVARGGDDVIFAGDGDDFICGNAGTDVLDGGGGDDRTAGGAGNDFITGVDGDDVIRGGPGADSLNFGDEEDGDDEVFGGSGDDDLHAGVGSDRLFGNAGDDVLSEGEVDTPLIDLLSGGPGVDTCLAGSEDDVRGCEIP
jgi:Ca2+-binding RTX toxin-like protein